MDLTLSPDEEAFRDELRTWLEENHPGEEPKGDEEEAFAFRREWQTKLHEGGWAGVSWPKEYGGRGASLIEQAIYSAEMVRSRAPSPANVLGLAMGGPTVIGHGTEEQKERFIQPILSGEEIWCQGFSEPESGSDLASLKTKAVKDDGDWVVTGQKVWTTFAHHSKWCMLVARTDPDVPKHKGLTYFLMDMEQDAVQVRPLRQITGQAEFNELFLEEARENGLDEDPVTRQRLAQLHMEVEALRINAYRGLTAIMKTGQPGPEGSLGKWAWSDINQSLTEASTEIRGPEAPIIDEAWTYRFLRARANSIDGGTTDILRN